MISLSYFELIIGGLILYCVICYIVVWTYVLVQFKTYKHISSPVVFIFYLAAIFAPVVPFVSVHHWIIHKQYLGQAKKLQKVSDWIANELRKHNIEVEESTTWSGIEPLGYGCHVVARVKDNSVIQVDTYQKVYADAIKRFPHLKPETICRAARPQKYLDEFWAIANDFREFFAPERSIPCKKCEQIEVYDHWYYWGDRQFHQSITDGYKEYSIEAIERVSGAQKKLSGFLCKSCEQKLIDTIDKSTYSLVSSYHAGWYTQILS